MRACGCIRPFPAQPVTASTPPCLPQLREYDAVHRVRQVGRARAGGISQAWACARRHQAAHPAHHCSLLHHPAHPPAPAPVAAQVEPGLVRFLPPGCAPCRSRSSQPHHTAPPAGATRWSRAWSASCSSPSCWRPSASTTTTRCARAVWGAVQCGAACFGGTGVRASQAMLQPSTTTPRGACVAGVQQDVCMRGRQTSLLRAQPLEPSRVPGPAARAGGAAQPVARAGGTARVHRPPAPPVRRDAAGGDRGGRCAGVRLVRRGLL